MKWLPASHSAVTVIWLSVSVPVLSELIALVAPRVSTSLRFATIAFAAASCLAPYASMACTNVGRPVGMAEIATAVARNSRSLAGSPRSRPMTTMSATADHAIAPSTLVSASSSRCSGDLVFSTEVSSVAMCPICVDIPVDVSRSVPVPRVTAVFWNAMLSRSPSPTSASASGSVALPIGALSPVSAASCVSIVAVRTSRPSAGTMSPASSRTTSPGTRSCAGTRETAPSRSTRLVGSCMVASASTLLRACISWRVPMTTLTSTRKPTIAAVEPCPIAMLTTATAMSMRFIGSRS